MLQLLRRARQKLVARQKFSQYVLYAIGEVVLIVIGILIAVRINIANENRKLDEIRANYYDQLLIELEQDSALLQTQIETLQKSIASYETYLDIFKTPNLEVYEFIMALSQVDRRVRNRKVIFNTNSIATLEYTGEIKYIPEEIRIGLVNLRRLQEFTAAVDDENDNAFVEGLRDAMQLGFSPLVYRLGNQPKLAKELNIEENYADIILVMEGSLTLRNVTEVERKERYEDLLEDISQLKGLITQASLSLVTR